MTPEDLKVSKKAQRLARMLDKELERIAGKPMGFMLVTFTLGVPNNRPTYISNCHREDMAGAMRELLKLWDEGMPDVPAHKVQ